MHTRILVGMLAVTTSCALTEGVKMVQTTRDVQSITAAIGYGERPGSVADVETAVMAAIAGVNGGKDWWGHPYLWCVRKGAQGVSYIVLSTGSDGRLDVPAIEDYFTRTDHVVLKGSEHWRDIAFRDGDALVTGGK